VTTTSAAEPVDVIASDIADHMVVSVSVRAIFTAGQETGSLILVGQLIEHQASILPGLTLDDIDSVERYVGKASADATRRVQFRLAAIGGGRKMPNIG